MTPRIIITKQSKTILFEDTEENVTKILLSDLAELLRLHHELIISGDILDYRMEEIMKVTRNEGCFFHKKDFGRKYTEIYIYREEEKKYPAIYFDMNIKVKDKVIESIGFFEFRKMIQKHADTITNLI